MTEHNRIPRAPLFPARTPKSSTAHGKLTGCLEFSEVDVDQDKVDDSGAVPIALLGLEDVAFLQTLAVEHLGVDLGERQLVHPRPLLCQEKLLETVVQVQNTIPPLIYFSPFTISSP